MVLQIGVGQGIILSGKNYNRANVLSGDLANFRVTARTKVVDFANSEVMN